MPPKSQARSSRIGSTNTQLLIYAPSSSSKHACIKPTANAYQRFGTAGDLRRDTRVRPHPEASHDLHLALPSPDVAPPELVAEEFMFAMLSLAASCARLGLPCLAAVVFGCCIVGRPLKFD